MYEMNDFIHHLYSSIRTRRILLVNMAHPVGIGSEYQ